MASNSKCIICQPWLLITIKILTLKSWELCVISYLSFHLQLSCKHLYSSTWKNKIFCFVLIQWFWINRKWSYGGMEMASEENFKNHYVRIEKKTDIAGGLGISLKKTIISINSLIPLSIISLMDSKCQAEFMKTRMNKEKGWGRINDKWSFLKFQSLTFLIIKQFYLLNNIVITQFRF